MDQEDRKKARDTTACVCFDHSFKWSAHAVSSSFFFFFFFAFFVCVTTVTGQSGECTTRTRRRRRRRRTTKCMRDREKQWTVRVMHEERQEKQMPSLWWKNAAVIFKMKWLCQMKDALTDFVLIGHFYSLSFHGRSTGHCLCIRWVHSLFRRKDVSSYSGEEKISHMQDLKRG